MNTHDGQRAVRDFAVEIPGATRLFERIGIDYCCGGAKALEEACAERGLDAAEILRSLEGLELEAGHDAGGADTWSLSTLADHIVETHHVFTREELARLDRLFDKVVAAHGARHTELDEMRDLFRAIAAELGPHMLKEEQVLFPYIRQLEQAAAAGATPPTPFFGTVRNPVRRMQLEHDSAGELLAKMRALGGEYTPPADACMSYRTLFEALDGLERDLHVHIHLENNILFPKAVALEAAER
jgi:regulator of cell morphogenesis and NO signaling